MNGDRDNWADWYVDTWCPILGPVPCVEGMTEGDPAGQAATLIHHLRRDFYNIHCMTTESVDAANRPCDPRDYNDFALPLVPLDPEWIAQARAINFEASKIERDALWTFNRRRKTRSGESEPLSLAGAFNECSDGRQGTTVESLERLLRSAVHSALDFTVNYAVAHGQPPPFKTQEWPIHDVLALLAIRAAADCIQDFLVGWRDQPEARRWRALANAQALDRLAREQRLLPVVRKATRQDEQRKAASAKPRTPKPLADARAKALAHPGNAKTRWRLLIDILKTWGFEVREYTTPNGDTAFEVHLASGPRTLTFKTFANQESRQRR